MVIQDTIADRGASYGDYTDGTQIAMDLFEIVQEAPSYRKMNAGQRYAMFMFTAKMARLLNGDPNHKDSWHDIAGYATRVEELLTEKPDPDGWIVWTGGPSPFPPEAGTYVDLKSRDGKTYAGVPASTARWYHIQSISDIVAYRVFAPSPTEDDRRP